MSDIAYVCRQRIEIDAGTVTEAPSPEFLGTYRFFVVVIDEDEARFGVWDGPHHEDARAVAAHWPGVFGYPVIDRSRRHA